MGLVSKQCVDFVKSFEGFSATPYYDCVHVKTLGYGMTGSEIAGLSYVTESQASQMLENLLNNNYAQPIKNNLDSRGVHLNQNQFDAITSFAYNCGTEALFGSTLYRNICNGIRDKSIITNNFEMWSMAGGRQIAGLLRRRQAEANMFCSSGNVADNNLNSISDELAEKYRYKEENVVGDKWVAVIQASLNQIKIFDDENKPLVCDGLAEGKTKESYKRFQEVIDVNRTGEWNDECNKALSAINKWYKWMNDNNRWNFNGN